jgi:hypothetical protein
LGANIWTVRSHGLFLCTLEITSATSLSCNLSNIFTYTPIYKWNFPFSVRPKKYWPIKIKVKLSLYLTKHHATKTYGGVEVQFHVFLTSALGGGEWLASRPGRFTSGERVPYTHWTGSWMDPRASLDIAV